VYANDRKPRPKQVRPVADIPQRHGSWYPDRRRHGFALFPARKLASLNWRCAPVGITYRLCRTKTKLKWRDLRKTLYIRATCRCALSLLSCKYNEWSFSLPVYRVCCNFRRGVTPITPYRTGRNRLSLLYSPIIPVLLSQRSKKHRQAIAPASQILTFAIYKRNSSLDSNYKVLLRLLRALILFIQISAFYKSFTYWLTYLLYIDSSQHIVSMRNR